MQLPVYYVGLVVKTIVIMMYCEIKLLKNVINSNSNSSILDKLGRHFYYCSYIAVSKFGNEADDMFT